MSINDSIIERMMNDKNVKRLGLTEFSAKGIVEAFFTSMMDVLIDKGNVEISEDIRFEIIPTKGRVHKLRGVVYNSTRSYKIKTSISNSLYERIKEEYDEYRV